MLSRSQRLDGGDLTLVREVGTGDVVGRLDGDREHGPGDDAVHGERAQALVHDLSGQLQLVQRVADQCGRDHGEHRFSHRVSPLRRGALPTRRRLGSQLDSIQA